MKKFPVKLLVSVLCVIAGVVLLTVTVAPAKNPCEKIIGKYISAINSENSKKMHDLEFSAEDYLDGTGLGELLGGIQDSYESETESGETTRMELFKSSAVSSRVPDDADKVKKIKLLGCSAGENISEYGITAAEYDILVEVTYTISEDGKETDKTICYGDTVSLAKGKSGYRIVG